MGEEEQAKEYLMKYFKASMATQIPDIPGSDVKGIVKIKRTSTTVEEARELTWTTYEKFKEMIDGGDASAKDYYAIDENWNLCVAISKEINGEVTIEMAAPIPYQTLISQYSVPFRYLMVMLEITQNPEYISYMCDMMVEGKQIDFTIFDSIQTTTDTSIYEYSLMEKWVEVEYIERNVLLGDGTIEKAQIQKDVPKTSGPTAQPPETTVVITKTNTITANVTYAKTWIVELENQYTNTTTTEYPLGEDGQRNPLDPKDEDEPPGDEGSWRVDQYVTNKTEVVKNTWTQAETIGEIKESEFLGLWKNSTGKPKTGADYAPNGKEVFYDVPNSREKESPLPNITNAEDYIFALLEEEQTQNYSDIMKYMLYKYFGKNYGVTELSIDIFKRSDFTAIKTSVIGGSAEAKVWFTLRNAGYSEYAVAGAMGSIYKESGFLSNNLQNTGNTKLGMTDEEYTAKVNSGEYTREQFVNDKIGYGLAQWTFSSRKANLYDYAQEKGVGIDDVNMQIEFLLQELSGRYANWENASSVEEAAIIFCNEFERPDPSQADLPTRIAKAQEYWEKYTGMTAMFENGSTIGVMCPRYYQSNQPWSGNAYNYKTGGTISSGGCGACALAMAVSGLTGETITPDIIVDYLNSLGIDTVNNGEASARAIATKYGLSYEHIDRYNKTAIDAALDSGKCLIFSIKENGIYTGGGHFIMCVGRQGDSYYVLESGSYYKTDYPYAYGEVFTAGNQGVFALGI